MAFSLIAELVVQPGIISTFATQVNIDQNFALVVDDITEDDVKVAGNWLFRVFVPIPVSYPSTFLTVPVYTKSTVLFKPFPTLNGVPVQVAFYRHENLTPVIVALFSE